MIPVAEALERLFALASPLPSEDVPLIDASDRVLARPVAARRTQPPFAASAMDGYALREDEAGIGASFTVIGDAAAGHRFDGTVGPGQAVRIFTGAPVPQGATRVVLQEDVSRDGDRITLGDKLDDGPHIRPAGADFAEGATLDAPRRLTPADIALLAAMNIATVPVARKPVVAIIATGDELVQPGEDPGPDQIIASNSYGIAALVARTGGHPRMLPIARDTPAALRTVLGLAQGADLVLTIGGASVGDHDLVGAVTEGMGMKRAFYKIAMRPGKPLMAGRLGEAVMIGLPGNPVSAMVCAELFVAPVLRAMLGLGAHPAPRRPATLATPLDANGPREHYMRARLDGDSVSAFPRQDSALLTVLSAANCLLIRPPHDGPRQPGDTVEVIALCPLGPRPMIAPLTQNGNKARTLAKPRGSAP